MKVKLQTQHIILSVFRWFRLHLNTRARGKKKSPLIFSTSKPLPKQERSLITLTAPHSVSALCSLFPSPLPQWQRAGKDNNSGFCDAKCFSSSDKPALRSPLLASLSRHQQSKNHCLCQMNFLFWIHLAKTLHNWSWQLLKQPNRPCTAHEISLPCS